MKRANIGICAAGLLAMLVTCLSPVDAARPSQFGKLWVRSHPFQIFGWSTTSADYLKYDATANAYIDCGMASALLPYPHVLQEAVTNAENWGLPWHGQLWATRIDPTFAAQINAISCRLDDNGWYIYDEPSDELLPGIGQVADWFRANRPNSLI